MSSDVSCLASRQALLGGSHGEPNGRRRRSRHGLGVDLERTRVALCRFQGDHGSEGRGGHSDFRRNDDQHRQPRTAAADGDPARQWGCYGATVLHPTHVPVVNEVYSPSKEHIDAAHEVLKAMEGALEKGTSVTRHKGVMIDYVDVRNALALLDEARAFGLDSREISPIWNDRKLLR